MNIHQHLIEEISFPAIKMKNLTKKQKIIKLHKFLIKKLNNTLLKIKKNSFPASNRYKLKKLKTINKNKLVNNIT